MKLTFHREYFAAGVMGGQVGGWQQGPRPQQPSQPSQQQPTPGKTPAGTPHHQMKSPSQPNYGRVNFDVGGKLVLT